MAASGAITRLMRNDHRHEKLVVRNPPITGPSAAARPITAPQTANAVARSRPWNVVEMIASVAGIISDAPIPSMRASPSTRLGTDHDTDASNEPAKNSHA